MTQTTDEAHHADESEGYSRGLNSRTIQMIAIGGAIGTGLFYGSGAAIESAGPSLILAYLAAGLAVFVIMRALGELREEQKKAKGKSTKKLLALRRQVARMRLEISQEIKNLNLTERAMQRLIGAIRKVSEEIRKTEREINSSEERLESKVSAESKKESSRKISEGRKKLAEIEDPIMDASNWA